MLAYLILAAEATFQSFKKSDHISQSLISWPNTWVNSRFEADSNYLDSCSKFDFFFKIEEKTLNPFDYHALIRFKQSSEGVKCLLSSLSPSEPDWKATCEYSFRGPSLIYGPFEITILHSSSKNIIAKDPAAGFLAFKNGSEPSGGTFSVSYQDTSSSRTVESRTSLVFQVTLPKESLFPGDFFELIPDPMFPIKNLELSWEESFSSSKLFKNTEVSVISESSQLFPASVLIFGLENEVLRGTNVSFSLSGFYNPSTVQKGGAYGWTLKVWRFGVKTLIQSYASKGPSLGTLPGKVNIKDFRPSVSSAFIPEDIINGLNVYWTLVFNCQHFIPLGGRFLVEFQGVTLNDYSIKTTTHQTRSSSSGPDPLFAYNHSGFALKSYFEASNKVFIELSPEQALPVSLTIKLEAYLKVLDYKEFGVSRIIAQDSNGAVIDELEKPEKVYLWKDRTSFDKDAGAFLMEAVDDTNEVKEFNKVGYFGIVAWINPKFEMNAGTSILIYMPVSTGNAAKADDLVFNENYYALVVSDVDSSGLTSSTFSSSIEANVSISQGLINVTLNSSHPSTTLFIFIGSGVSSEPNLTYTQLIPTKSSSEIILKYSNSTNTYIYTSLLYFSSSSLEVSFMMLCSNVYKAGSPGKVNYSTVFWPVPGNYSLQVFFEFQEKQQSRISNFDVFSPSNLNHGDPYPSSDDKKMIRVSSTKELYYLQTSNLETSDEKIVFPLPLTTNGNNYRVEVKIFAVSTLFKERFLLYSGVSNFFETTDEDVTSGKPTSHEQLIKKILTPVTVMLAIRNEPVDSDGNGEVELDPSWYSFMLITPSGWRSTDSVLTSGTSLTSENYLFPFSVYYKNSVNILYETVPYATHYLRFTTGWMTSTSLDYTFVIGYTVSNLEFSGLSCVSIKGSVNIKPEKLQVYNYGPNVISSYSYNARTTSTSLSFMSSTSRIQKGSVIRIMINQWKPSFDVVWTVLNGSKAINGTFQDLVWVSQEIDEEIQANSEVTVQVDHVFLPKFEEKTILGFSSIQVLHRDAIYLYWDEEGSTTVTDLIEFVSPVQAFSNASVWVYPDVQGSKDVTFGLAFHSEYKIPAQSMISINANFKNHFVLDQDLSTSHFRTSAWVKAGRLFIVTAEDILKNQEFSLILDKAFDISPDANFSSDLVLLNVTCDDLDKTKAITDVPSKSSSQFFEIKPKPSCSVLKFLYSASSLTPGENNWYSFQVKLDCNISEAFFIQVQALGDFEVVPGTFFERSEFTGLKLIKGQKSKGSSLLCYSFHWIVSCLFEEFHPVDKTIEFKLFLKNGQSSAKFNLFVINEEQNLLVQPFYGQEELIFNHFLKNSIDLYFAIANYSDTSKAYHDLILYAKANFTVDVREQVWVTLPRPYDLEFTNSGSVLCSLVYYNQETSTQQEIKRNTCRVNGNSVIFSLFEKTSFLNQEWVRFILHDLESPENGFRRNRWPFEKNQNFKIFTRKFKISHFRPLENITDSVFSNLNSAFLGFYPNKDFVRLMVNDGKSIDLAPGTYSGPYVIKSKDGDIVSENIQITGFEIIGNDKIKRFDMSEQGSYSLNYLKTNTSFFIGTNATTPQGFYFIDWIINETTFPGHQARYIKPRPTLVQVSNKKKYEIQLTPENPCVPVQKSSFPISISSNPEKLTVLPFSEVSLNLSSSDASIILKISPNPVPLQRKLQSNQFTISCENCDPYSEYNVTIQVTGNDSAAYYSSSYFTFNYQFEYEVAANASILIENISSTGFEFSIRSDSRSVVTWCLVSSQIFDSDIVDYQYLLTRVNVLGSGSHLYPSVAEQIKEVQEKYEKIYSEYSELNDIAREIQKIGSQIYIAGQSLANEGVTKISSFSILFPGNYYKIYAYIDNFSPDSPTTDFITQQTAGLANHVLISLESEVTDVESLKFQLVSILKWRPKLIQITSERFRSLSGWRVYMYADPLSSISPSIVLKTNQKSISTATGESLKYDEIYADDFEDNITFSGTWVKMPQYLQLNYFTNTDGELICIVQNGSVSISSLENVYLGVDSSGEPVEQHRKPTTSMKSDSWNKSSQDLKRFFVDCIVCNNYPITPNCSEVISASYNYYDLDGQKLLSSIFWLVFSFF